MPIQTIVQLFFIAGSLRIQNQQALFLFQIHLQLQLILSISALKQCAFLAVYSNYGFLLLFLFFSEKKILTSTIRNRRILKKF